MPRLCLIYTGGTIGMIRENGVLKPPKDASNFTAIAPELTKIAAYEFVPLLNKDSTNMNPSDWTLMAQAVYDRISDDYDGFVIAHGTDTMHFSASALAFAFGPNLNKPVVFTGSQTDASVLHGDARVNLLRSFRVACEPLAEVVICFGDYVYRGCRTQKQDERKFNAFGSPAFYPIADITERILIHPTARLKRPVSPPINFQADFESDIFQVSLIPGLRPGLLESLLDPSKWDGIVLLSFGAGNVPNEEDYGFVPFIRQATRLRIPVIIASQFPANSTQDTAYEPGVEAIRAGAIPTGNMTNAAATAKFRWVLARARAMIRNGDLDPNSKLEYVTEVMGRAYVSEMDTDENAQRNL